MAVMVPVVRAGYRCERCAHEWVPRNISRDPKVCPSCKSPYWDRPRKISGENVTGQPVSEGGSGSSNLSDPAPRSTPSQGL